ncbi:MAG: hypothetical protein U0W40_12500 [Acidimicrobiia bacterium]
MGDVACSVTTSTIDHAMSSAPITLATRASCVPDATRAAPTPRARRLPNAAPAAIHPGRDPPRLLHAMLPATAPAIVGTRSTPRTCR